MNRHKKTLKGDEYVHYPDCGYGFKNVYMYQGLHLHIPNG